MALLLSTGSFLLLSEGGKLLLSTDKSVSPPPLIPPIVVQGAFDYGELASETRALITEFGLSVRFVRMGSTGDRFGKRQGDAQVFNGYAIKDRKSSEPDREPVNVTDTSQAKFLVVSDVEVQIGDTFTFHLTKYTVDTTTLVNPGGLVIYQEITVK